LSTKYISVDEWFSPSYMSESTEKKLEVHVKAVIFDLDGTVATFNLDYKTVRALVKGYLMNRGVPGSVLSMKEPVFVMVKKAEMWAEHAGKPTKFLDDIHRDVMDITERFELEAAANTTLLPGVMETLKELRKAGLKIGLCTINSEKSVNRILERFSLTPLFDAVVSRDRVRHVKPDPEHIEAVLKVLGVSAEETMVVGDSKTDMESARELGAVAVGLPTGVSSVEQLMASGADYVVTSMLDLPVLAGCLNGDGPASS
jgi:phosphoglycolate phosphatase